MKKFVLLLSLLLSLFYVSSQNVARCVIANSNYDFLYEIARKLSHKFPCDEEYIEKEIRSAGPRTFMFALVPEYMTGKLVNEA